MGAERVDHHRTKIDTSWHAHLPSAKIDDDLLQAQQFEMIDEERADKRDDSTE
jgi:hypothetical protein